MSFDSDLTRSMVEPIILKLVNERPMYGYEIIKVVNERTNNAFKWKEGTIYPCLHRMEGAKVIRGEWQDGDTGRQRRYYAITRKGRALLKEKTLEWSAFSVAVNALLFGGDGVVGLA